MLKSSLRQTAPLLSIAILAACGAAALAQTPTPAPKARTGYAPVTLMNRDDVRILRVEIEVGGVRAVHKHDDVKYHLFIPVTGSIELTVGPDAPVKAPPGQAFYIPKGTMHGFRNTGTTPAAVIEVFAKEAPAAARTKPGPAADPNPGNDAVAALVLGVAAAPK